MKRGASGINALIAVNKPVGMSSHDVVNQVRRSVGEKRVGHAGTLDPAASGVLVVGIGQGTRLMGYLTAERKSYLARIQFGKETTTDDAEGEAVRIAALPQGISDVAYARQTLSSHVGKHMQTPPAYSAISVGGVRSYTRARAGENVELKARPIEILSSELVSIEEPDSWLCSFEVSKGTYIRAIARDLGRELGSAAHLSALCRTCSGDIGLAECLSLDDIADYGSNIVSQALDPVASLGLAVRRLNEREFIDASSGKQIALQGPFDSSNLETLALGDKVSLVYGQKLYGIWECVGSRLKCVVNFPAGIEGVRNEHS